MHRSTDLSYEPLRSMYISTAKNKATAQTALERVLVNTMNQSTRRSHNLKAAATQTQESRGEEI